MKRRARFITAFFPLVLTVLPVGSARGLEEADRLWLVAEQATTDGLTLVARRALERLVAQYPQDKRVPEATLLLGRARLVAGDTEAALEAFRHAQTFRPPPGRPLEAKFWEAEALFRLDRFAEAGKAYDTIVRTDAASPLAPDALYGFAWTELEQQRPEAAVKALREFLQTWPDHALMPSATYQLGRALMDLKRFKEALPLLESFRKGYAKHKLAPDAQFLLGWARVQTGDPRGGLADLRAFADANPQHKHVAEARRLITETIARDGGDRNDLQEAYNSLMARSPATAESLSDAATIAGRLGRARDQEAAWRKLRADFPDHALTQRASLELANVAFKRKEWTETVALARTATNSEDDALRADAWLLAGEAELKLRHFAAAEKAFKAAADVKSADPPIRYRALAGLGLAHEEQRAWKPALTAYEAVAASSPDSTLRNWARERAQAVKGRLGTTPGNKPDKPGSKPDNKVRTGP